MKSYQPALKTMLIVLSIINFIGFIYSIVITYWPGPYLDYWADIKNVKNLFDGKFYFLDLLTAHNNAHRILIPRLIFFLDYKLFDGSNVLIITTGILCKIISAYIFFLLIRDFKGTEKLFLVLLISLGIFHISNVYNIIFSSDIQWDLMILFSLLSIFFYTRGTLEKNHWPFIYLAYIFYLLGILSQAGATGVILIFIFISLINLRFVQGFIAFSALLVIIKINSLLPLSHGGASEFDKATGTLLFNSIAIFRYMYNYIPGAASHNYFQSNFYLFLFFIFIFFFSFLSSIREKNHNQTILFMFSVLFLIMMFSIAASRSNWRPGSWIVSRYQIIPIMLWLSLSLSAISAIGINKSKTSCLIKYLIGINLIYILSINTINYYKEPFQLSNKIFQTHAYMFFNGITQRNALPLWPFVKPNQDPISEPDPFFRTKNLAYYHNKQIESDGYFKYFSLGDKLIDMATVDKFQTKCRKVSVPITFAYNKHSNLLFSVSLNSSFFYTFIEITSRKTYFVLNENGIIIGFSYLQLSDQLPFSPPTLTGIINERSVAFIVDIEDNQPSCHYQL